MASTRSCKSSEESLNKSNDLENEFDANIASVVVRRDEVKRRKRLVDKEKRRKRRRTP